MVGAPLKPDVQGRIITGIAPQRIVQGRPCAKMDATVNPVPGRARLETALTPWRETGLFRNCRLIPPPSTSASAAGRVVPRPATTHPPVGRSPRRRDRA